MNFFGIFIRCYYNIHKNFNKYTFKHINCCSMKLYEKLNNLKSNMAQKSILNKVSKYVYKFVYFYLSVEQNAAVYLKIKK